MFIYFDASALAKRYLLEAGTELVNEAFASVPKQNMTCATIGILELISVLVRTHNRGELSRPKFSQAMTNLRHELILDRAFSLTSINDSMMLSASIFIPKHNINATDALILRSCLALTASISPQLVLWSCDKRLLRAANHEGISIFDPEVETLETLHKQLKG